MGFLDKVKAQAEQVATKAQQGMAQGQAKLDTMQARKQADALLRDLGAAYYAEQRTGGSHIPVDELVGRLDEHAVAHGAIDTTPSAPSPPSPPVPAQTGDGAAPAATAAPATGTGVAEPPPAGGFSLDDL